jgi:hypothetical protein
MKYLDQYWDEIPVQEIPYELNLIHDYEVKILKSHALSFRPELVDHLECYSRRDDYY